MVSQREPVPSYRKTTARGDATRERIVEAAADLMYVRGAAGTSLDDIRTATSTSKSQLYHYFADKDALVRAVIVKQTDRVLSGQEEYILAFDSMPSLRAWCEAILSIQEQTRGRYGCPIGSLASELAESSEQARRLLADSFERWESLLKTGLMSMRHHGILREDADTGDLAGALLAALQGGLLLNQSTRRTRHLQLALDMALAHVERACV